jgi:hypothetical protein
MAAQPMPVPTVALLHLRASARRLPMVASGVAMNAFLTAQTVCAPPVTRLAQTIFLVKHPLATAHGAARDARAVSSVAHPASPLGQIRRNAERQRKIVSGVAVHVPEACRVARRATQSLRAQHVLNLTARAVGVALVAPRMGPVSPAST